MDKFGSPQIPYLQMYLDQLQSISEKEKDFVGPKNLINFQKHFQIFEVIRDVLVYQETRMR